MKKILAVVLMLGLAAAHAEDKKPDAKKAEKSKPAAKSEKNAAQKAEHGIYKWARENKIWTQSK